MQANCLEYKKHNQKNDVDRVHEIESFSKRIFEYDDLRVEMPEVEVNENPKNNVN